ncbi:MAG: hypothetical protein Q8L79_16800 [Methylobacter sp.]|nr:hypothetical protein [Methylobacter sp.]MDP1666769.1 hypothetical protein [Methylobacter sp.]
MSVVTSPALADVLTKHGINGNKLRDTGKSVFQHISLVPKNLFSLNKFNL